MYRLGIDLGGTNIVAGVVNEKYEIIATAKCKTNCPRPAEEIIDDMAKCALEAVKKAGGENVPVIRCESYDEVVNTARNIAKDGDVVLLSPASTSFDMFNNFEERGNLFKKLVNELN